MSSVDTNKDHHGDSEHANVIESRFLVFSLGQEEYAIPLLVVKEVIAMPEFTKIPNTPSYFLGIMNLRGQIISVMDLKQKFSIKSKESAENAVIICDLHSLSIGVVVDSVDSVLSPEPEFVSDTPEMSHQMHSDYITNVYRKEKKLIMFLDIAKILNVNDHAALSKASTASH